MLTQYSAVCANYLFCAMKMRCDTLISISICKVSHQTIIGSDKVCLYFILSSEFIFRLNRYQYMYYD